MAQEKEPPEPLSWQSKFTPEAGEKIFIEASILVISAVVSTTLVAIIWWAPTWIGLNVSDTEAAREFQEFALVFLAGILGGTAFAMKWLHHSVGLGPRTNHNPGGWTIDRRLWRFFVPLLSGVIATAFYAVLQSGLLQLEIATDNRNAFAVAAGFIVGYFSDRAAAKLREVAYVLFGEKGKEEE